MITTKRIGFLLLVPCFLSFTYARDLTPETDALLQALKTISGKYTLLGHQDATVYGVDWFDAPDESDVKRTIGAYPAVYGWDVGHIEIGKTENLDNVSFDLMRNRMVEAYKRGSINTVSWHLNNPINGQNSWDTTHHSVREILPNGKYHATYNSYLYELGNFLESVKTEDGTSVPLVFRPFHEHTGSWFWWGKAFCTPEEYIALWQYTVDYLRNVRKLKHLLIAYSSSTIETQANYLERYPGDEYVDIVGFDDYCMGDEKAYQMRMANSLQILTEIAKERDKIPAITETGYEQIPNPRWFTQTLYPIIKDRPVAWVLLWRNAYNRPNHYYAPYPSHPAAGDFKEFHRLPDILFEDRLAPLHIYRTPH